MSRAYNALMRCRLAPPVLAIAFVLTCWPPTYAQVSPVNLEAENKVCATSSDKDPSGPEVTIADLNFEGDLRMPTRDQDEISTSLKQRMYSGDRDGVTTEVLERVRAAWQDHGFFSVQVRGGANVLTSNPASERIAVRVHVDEGEQYRLGGIRFRNNKAISNVGALRNLFPLKDGDIFSREKVAKGLDNLAFAYGELGYFNFTSIPNTQTNEESQMISLDVDVDEGKQFYVSSISVVGLDDHVLKDSLLQPGDIYNQRLANLFVEKHASPPLTNALPDSRIHRHLDERAATVAITFDFRRCPVE
jgi:outer membrane protein assembly factor BamA